MNTCTTACNPCRDMIQEYVENLCAEGAAKEVETHLALCADCRLEYTAAKALTGALDALPEMDVPEAFSCSVMDRVAREDKKRRYAVAGAFSGVVALALIISAALAGPGLLVEGARAAISFAGGAFSLLSSTLVFLAGKTAYAVDAALAAADVARAPLRSGALPVFLWGAAVLTAAAFLAETAGVLLFARRTAN